MSDKNTTRAIAGDYLKEVQESDKLEQAVYAEMDRVRALYIETHPDANTFSIELMVTAHPDVANAIGEQQFSDRKATARGAALVTAAIEEMDMTLSTNMGVLIEQNNHIIKLLQYIAKKA